MERILLVDDEPSFARGLKGQLEQSGFQVSVAHDGEEGYRRARDEGFDLVLLDVMLPKMDGIEVCQRLRAKSVVPIIMLTAKDDDIDKILGLEVGADDYLTKPFNFRELLARIKAILRRVGFSGREQGRKEVIIDGRLVFVPGSSRLYAGEKEVPLTVKEAALLKLLAENPGRVFSREELLERVWGTDYYGSLRTVDVHVSRLRSKLEKDPASPEILLTRWGHGYFINEKRTGVRQE